jgi:glycosyltransferase involved in cell wall biosynthesis
MGRLNKIKGPDLLLRAFASIKEQIPDYQLVFIGPDEGMKNDLIRLAKELGVTNSVSFLGFIGGDDKSSAYRLASLLVVPSRSEAMSIVALEAGICKTPAMLTDQCGFSEIRTIHKDLEVPANTEGIAKGLVNFFSQPDATKKYGESFYNLVSKKYTWDAASKKYLDLYNKLLVRNIAS